MHLRNQPTSRISLCVYTGRDFYRNARWCIWIGLRERGNPRMGELRYVYNFEWSTASLPHFLRRPRI